MTSCIVDRCTDIHVHSTQCYVLVADILLKDELDTSALLLTGFNTESSTGMSHGTTYNPITANYSETSNSGTQYNRPAYNGHFWRSQI